MSGLVEIIEVGPRDGLQNEKMIFTSDQKVSFVERLIAAGVRRIEVGSFVSPRRVPQMAGTDELIAMLPIRDGVVYIGLALNLRGAERALATGVHEIGTVCIATDEFSIRNQGQTSDESLQTAKEIVKIAVAEDRRAQATIGAAFGCPFEGEVDADRVVAMALSLAETSPLEIALADTIGVAAPAQVECLVARVVNAIAPIPVRVHFHNTRNTGLANVWAAVGAGASIVDSSLGGIGGCPFAPGAEGNVSTEDVVYMLERSRISTSLHLSKLMEASDWLSGVMRKPLASRVARAGEFPPRLSKDYCE